MHLDVAEHSFARKQTLDEPTTVLRYWRRSSGEVVDSAFQTWDQNWTIHSLSFLGTHGTHQLGFVVHTSCHTVAEARPWRSSHTSVHHWTAEAGTRPVEKVAAWKLESCSHFQKGTRKYLYVAGYS